MADKWLFMNVCIRRTCLAVSVQTIRTIFSFHCQLIPRDLSRLFRGQQLPWSHTASWHHQTFCSCFDWETPSGPKMHIVKISNLLPCKSDPCEFIGIKLRCSACSVFSFIELCFALQVWEAGHHPKECSEAEAGAGEVAGGGRALEPEGPAEPDGVRWRRTFQKTQAAHKLHTAGDRSPELVLWEERPADRAGDHGNCQRAELRPRGCASLVLQPATDAEKHQQDQCLPGSVATSSRESSPRIFSPFFETGAFDMKTQM